MKTIYFDEKVEIWRRNTFLVPDYLDESKLKEIIEAEGIDTSYSFEEVDGVQFVSSELMSDTETSTFEFEIEDENYNTLYTNGD